MERNRCFPNQLLVAVGLAVITLLSSAYVAVSDGNPPAAPWQITQASYSSREGFPKVRDFRGYRSQDLSAGKFLVASEQVRDPRFAKTIILMLHYDSRGASGLIINRPTKVRLSRAFPDIKGIEKTDDDVYFGGPVAFNQITMVIQASSKPEESMKIFDNVYISNSRPLLERIIGNRRRGEKFRLYSGYAGWGAGQLESEIARGDWSVLESDPRILFDKAPDKLWQKLAPRKGEGLEI